MSTEMEKSAKSVLIYLHRCLIYNNRSVHEIGNILILQFQKDFQN